MTDRQEPPLELRAALAFGQPLRDGIELVRELGGGTIVVLGYDATEAPLLDGGDAVDQPVTDEAIQRAHSDGATILNDGLDRITRKHTKLTPWPTTPVTSLGARHAAAERYAAQTGRPVVVVSAERRTVTLFANDKRYVLHKKAELRTAVEDLRGHLRALS
jgi:diadenylate cyclase